MRFRDLSQSAIECSWERWKCTIRDMLDEFNEDIFNGRGWICENHYREPLYLLLETKQGCLYIFPIPGNQVVLRLYRNKLEKINPCLMAEINNEEHGNFICGIRVPIETKGRFLQTKWTFQNELAEAFKTVYKEYWTKLLY
jgi:hypothetical protein